MDPEPDVVVVGSANLDLTVRVPHHPARGETVLGGDHERTPGGKGANQAVAASRLGVRVAIVGRVGPDDIGEELRQSLENAGVDCRYLDIEPGSPSGTALIGVDNDGENTIIVSPGANSRVCPEDIYAAAAIFTQSAVTLTQLEIPTETVLAAAATSEGTVLLNPAPVAPLPPALLDRVDVLIPNRIELAQLADSATPEEIKTVEELARALPVSTVVVTLGAQGALLVKDGDALHISAPSVKVVDTTGAGDAFCGALAAGLARGIPIEEAMLQAIHAGAISTTRRGALPSLPTAAEVNSLTVET